ncbi:hypothetical protein ACXM0N_20305 [Peribacillus simplex]
MVTTGTIMQAASQGDECSFGINILLINKVIKLKGALAEDQSCLYGSFLFMQLSGQVSSIRCIILDIYIYGGEIDVNQRDKT